MRARLVAQHGRLAGALAKRIHASDGRFKSLAARLDGLSPLAVLGRGYAVAWDGARTTILRDANDVSSVSEIIVRLRTWRA